MLYQLYLKTLPIVPIHYLKEIKNKQRKRSSFKRNPLLLSIFFYQWIWRSSSFINGTQILLTFFHWLKQLSWNAGDYFEFRELIWILGIFKWNEWNETKIAIGSSITSRIDNSRRVLMPQNGLNTADSLELAD